MTDVVVAGYVRSPFAFAHKGALAPMRPDDLAAQVVQALVAKTGVTPADIEDLIIGCAFPEAEQGLNMARYVALRAGLPISVAGATVNRFCGSSMYAIHMAAGAIRMQAGEAFICAGVESMTRVPMGGYNPMPNPALYESYPEAYAAMGDTAENVAKRYQIGRAAQDAFAVESQAKAAKARAAGWLDDEVVAVSHGDTRIAADGCLRPETTAEDLAGLKPAFDQDGTVTAGTSSPLTDGAAATLICSADYAARTGLTPMARLKSIAVAGCEPEIMGIGPVHATRKALARAALTVGDLDLIELNEAFASQALACIGDLGLPADKVNVDGGAIAFGHPLGATGARITGKASALLARNGGRYALATQCIGGGQGIATILEAVS